MDERNIQNNQNIILENTTPQTGNGVEKKSTIPKIEDFLLPSNKKKFGKEKVRDPVFAARVLEEQKKVFSGNENSKNNILPKPPTVDKNVLTKKTLARGIRTYSRDIKELIKGQKTSVIQIATTEQKKRDATAKNISPKSKKNKTLRITSIALIFLGLFAIAGGIFVMTIKNKKDTPKETKKIKGIIFAEQYKEMNISKLTKHKTIKAVSSEIKSLDIRLDYIEHILPVEKLVSAKTSTNEDFKILSTVKSFFTKIGVKMPEILLRSLDKKFMLGIHSFNGNQPFLIFKTNFFENTFAGMLLWEKNMARDLFPIFAISGKSRFYDKKFEDIVIKNRDIRVLFDENKKTMLLYSFFGKDTLIITTNKDTLDEVITRIQRP